MASLESVFSDLRALERKTRNGTCEEWLEYQARRHGGSPFLEIGRPECLSVVHFQTLCFILFLACSIILVVRGKRRRLGTLLVDVKTLGQALVDFFRGLFRLLFCCCLGCGVPPALRRHLCCCCWPGKSTAAKRRRSGGWMGKALLPLRRTLSDESQPMSPMTNIEMESLTSVVTSDASANLDRRAPNTASGSNNSGAAATATASKISDDAIPISKAPTSEGFD